MAVKGINNSAVYEHEKTEIYDMIVDCNEGY